MFIGSFALLLLQHYGKRAVQLYREAGKKVFGEIKYMNMSRMHSPCMSRLEPTFWEFVQYVVRNPLADEHWKPYSHSCAVCSVTYTFVIKFERLEEEEMELMSILGMSERFPPMFLKMKSGRENVTEKYLKMLRKEDCMKLVEVYSQDIERFGYREDIQKTITNIYD